MREEKRAAREADLAHTKGLTFAEIGQRWGVCGSRARQIVLQIEADRRERKMRGAIPTPIPADWPIKHLPLSIRTLNCLSNEGWRIYGDLLGRGNAELLRVPNFGRKSLNELRTLMDRLECLDWERIEGSNSAWEEICATAL